MGVERFRSTEMVFRTKEKKPYWVVEWQPENGRFGSYWIVDAEGNNGCASEDELSRSPLEECCDNCGELVGENLIRGPKVIITVRGGIADVIQGEGDADIEIRDYDLEGQGDRKTVQDEEGDEYIQKLY
jgi:hypothetical protein